MDILYKSSRIKKLLESDKKLFKKYGQPQAEKITQRINELDAAESLNDIKVNPSFNLHYLDREYKACLAINLLYGFRLIIEPQNGEKGDYSSITIVKIIDAKDYHKGK